MTCSYFDVAETGWAITSTCYGLGMDLKPPPAVTGKPVPGWDGACPYLTFFLQGLEMPVNIYVCLAQTVHAHILLSFYRGCL